MYIFLSVSLGQDMSLAPVALGFYASFVYRSSKAMPATGLARGFVYRWQLTMSTTIVS